jgi:glycosyltransferase involved in cell wall biosynthesis
LKILHIITGLSNGGAEASLYRLTTSDCANSHHVISLMDRGVYGDRLENNGISVHTLDMSRAKVSIQGIRKLYRLIRTTEPDIVQTWMYHADLIGGLVARLAGVKSVVWGIRGGEINKKNTALSTIIVMYICALLSRWVPKVIISNSIHAAQVHAKLGYTRKKLIIIHNGYFLNQFLPSTVAREIMLMELDVKRNNILIGMVARFDPYKDHENLFAALSELKGKRQNLTCLLIGSGMDIENQHLIKLVERYGVQKLVKLIGPREDVHSIMAALDLNVLSSVAESFPNVLAEAMVYGTPCVTTDVGDAALIVGDTGWIVPPSDPIALSNAILEALNEMGDWSKWKARKKACRTRIIENYTLERMINNYNRVWCEVSNDL